MIKRWAHKIGSLNEVRYKWKIQNSIPSVKNTYRSKKSNAGGREEEGSVPRKIRSRSEVVLEDQIYVKFKKRKNVRKLCDALALPLSPYAPPSMSIFVSAWSSLPQ